MSLETAIDLAYEHALNKKIKHDPYIESFILQSSWFCYFYALNVLEGQFPRGESKILENHDTAYLYVQNVTKTRWPRLEMLWSTVKDCKRDWRLYCKLFDLDPENPL